MRTQLVAVVWSCTCVCVCVCLLLDEKEDPFQKRHLRTAHRFINLAHRCSLVQTRTHNIREINKSIRKHTTQNGAINLRPKMKERLESHLFLLLN